MPVKESEFAQELEAVMGLSSPWLLRWGMLLVLSLLAMLAVCAYLIRVPEYRLERLTFQHRADRWIGLVLAPAEDRSVFAVGQEVQIRLDSFPAEGFEGLSGQITAIVDEREGGIGLEIESVEGHSGFQKPIQTLKSGMKGTAKIITGKQRLYERLLGFSKRRK